MSTLSKQLTDAVSGYQQARREKNSDNLLRRQKDLLDALAAVDQATQGDNSSDSTQLRSAVNTARQALSGGNGKVDDSLAALQQALGVDSPNQQTQATDPLVAAQPVAKKAADFRAALSSGDAGNLARLQKELLDEVTRAETAIQSDHSQNADQVRSALASVRDGASGDRAKLDAGLTALGGQAGNGDQGNVSTSNAQPADIAKAADELKGNVEALQRAVATGNADEQLRQQRNLYDAVARAKAAANAGQGKQAEALRSALDSIGNVLGGDTTKLDDADRQLVLATGKAPAAAAAAAPQANADLGPALNSLDDRLTAVQRAVQQKDPDALAKAQTDLRDAVNHASDSLQSLPAAKAEKLRAALNAAGEASGGDLTKVQAARDMLKQASQ
jgi:hypothetical protein